MYADILAGDRLKNILCCRESEIIFARRVQISHYHWVPVTDQQDWQLPMLRLVSLAKLPKLAILFVKGFSRELADHSWFRRDFVQGLIKRVRQTADFVQQLSNGLAGRIIPVGQRTASVSVGDWFTQFVVEFSSTRPDWDLPRRLGRLYLFFTGMILEVRYNSVGFLQPLRITWNPT